MFTCQFTCRKIVSRRWREFWMSACQQQRDIVRDVVREKQKSTKKTTISEFSERNSARLHTQ